MMEYINIIAIYVKRLCPFHLVLYLFFVSYLNNSVINLAFKYEVNN
jgi:hypothetical protein